MAAKYHNMSYTDIRPISQFSNVNPASTKVLWGVKDNQYSGSNLNLDGTDWNWLCNAIDIYWGKPSLTVTGNVTSVSKPTIATTTDLLNFIQTTAQAVNKAHSLITELEARITALENADTTISVTSVSISPANATVENGKTKQFTATVSPTNATNKAVTWSTSNSSIATVSTNGLVTVLQGGNKTVKVRATSKADSSKYAEATITCKDAEPSTVYKYYVGKNWAIGTTPDYTTTNYEAFWNSSDAISKNSINEIKEALTGTISIGSGESDFVIIAPEEVINSIENIKGKHGYSLAVSKLTPVNGYATLISDNTFSLDTIIIEME